LLVLIMTLISNCTSMGQMEDMPLTVVDEMTFIQPGQPLAGNAATVRGLYRRFGPQHAALYVSKLQDNQLQQVTYRLDTDLGDEVAYVEVEGVIGEDFLQVVNWRSLPLDVQRIQATCGRAIARNADKLQGIDWPSISHENYREVSVDLSLPLSELMSPQVDLIGIDANQSLIICAFQGPTQPARQGLVERWPKLYPIYDLKVDRVNRVVVTIEGQTLQ
jgi:hypothetical protein